MRKRQRQRRDWRERATAAGRWWAASLALGCLLPEVEYSASSDDSSSCQGASCAVQPGGAGPAGDGETAGETTLRLPLGGVSGLSGTEACLSETSRVTVPPVALYLMLDGSASMGEGTGTGLSKWEALERALNGFAQQPPEDDVLLGLQFFPLPKPGSSFTCTQHSDCGPTGGPCFLSTCRAATTLDLCTSDADCPGGPTTNPCVTFGLCANSDVNAPIACQLGSECGNNLGACQDFVRTCTNAAQCSSLSYAAPAVEIGSVSVRAAEIQQALAARPPQGISATAPAFEGALSHARTWALAHPEQTVLVVLATDGLPAACEQVAASPPPLDQVLALAAASVAADVSIRTLVIGVLAPEDAASINGVHAIAQAGGTSRAATIDSTGDVEQEFLRALRAASAAAVSCKLPLPSSATLDLSHAELRLDDGLGSTQALTYTAGSAGCEATPDGWYYDIERAPAITLCPSLCARVRPPTTAGLLLEIGCAAPAP